MKDVTMNVIYPDSRLPASDRPSPLKDRLNDIIIDALADLDACEQDAAFTIDMAQWRRTSGGVCRVCLAGAVMAQRLPHTTEFLRQEYEAFLAVDHVRAGCLYQAVAVYYGDSVILKYDDAIAGFFENDAIACELRYGNLTYDNDRDKWKTAVRNIAGFLQTCNL